MFIFSKDGEIILNTEHMVELFLSSREQYFSIVAKTINGSNLVLGKYDTKEQARIALAIVFKELGMNKNVIVSTDKQVRAEIIKNASDPQKYHVGGKKTKGYGGS